MFLLQLVQCSLYFLYSQERENKEKLIPLFSFSLQQIPQC